MPPFTLDCWTLPAWVFDEAFCLCAFECDTTSRMVRFTQVQIKCAYHAMCRPRQSNHCPNPRQRSGIVPPYTIERYFCCSNYHHYNYHRRERISSISFFEKASCLLVRFLLRLACCLLPLYIAITLYPSVLQNDRTKQQPVHG